MLKVIWPNEVAVDQESAEIQGLVSGHDCLAAAIVSRAGICPQTLGFRGCVRTTFSKLFLPTQRAQGNWFRCLDGKASTSWFLRRLFSPCSPFPHGRPSAQVQARQGLNARSLFCLCGPTKSRALIQSQSALPCFRRGPSPVAAFSDIPAVFPLRYGPNGTSNHGWIEMVESRLRNSCKTNDMT
jgi:hypothetical protein